MDDANTNRIFDYEDIGWAENRSKRLHDPLLMANVKDGKKKKDRASSLKTQVPKTPKKSRSQSLMYHPSFVYGSLCVSGI
ncbi:hypothetical protein H5410_056180 [Solanum commersonii]|uniref:Uncharacterized protein n=1 Tax=Solanum commersonii TaxID=4109 RepID=A0A9J5WMC7_SOLCO|nr:hypothetical protein H5410_056180 [Solanum commersonii]